jgi:PAS domain S-box-containing protein
MKLQKAVTPEKSTASQEQSRRSRQLENRIAELTRANKRQSVSEDLYRHRFNNVPVSLWEEDFSAIKQHINALQQKGIRDFRKYFSSHPEEIAMLVGKVKIREVNQTTLDLYGAENFKELQKGLPRIFNKHSYDVFKEEIIALAGGRREFCSEASNVSLSGAEKHIAIKVAVAPGHENDWSVIWVAILDITDLKREEREERQQQEKYRAFFHGASEAMLVADVATGIILEANQKAGELIDTPLEEIVGMHFSQFFPKQENDRCRKMLQEHVDSGGSESGDLCLQNRSGLKVPVSLSSSIQQIGETKYFLGIFRQAAVEHGYAAASHRQADRRKPEPGAANNHDLSQRELQVLRGIAAGKTNKTIAEEHCISIKTVQTYRARLMKKTGARNAADLVCHATRTGLVK